MTKTEERKWIVVSLGFCLFFWVMSMTSCGKSTEILQGPVGVTGAAGTSCMITPVVGGAEVVCGETATFIANGAAGPQGVAGSIGATGATGTTGAQGVPGTSVTAVQFCTKYTSAYPSTFPESGICLGGSLYAVYWDDKNAWLTLIPPGYYDSTSTSAPCDFTVGPNCLVTD